MSGRDARAAVRSRCYVAGRSARHAAVAILSAVETVTPKILSTIEAETVLARGPPYGRVADGHDDRRDSGRRFSDDARALGSLARPQREAG